MRDTFIGRQAFTVIFLGAKLLHCFIGQLGNSQQADDDYKFIIDKFS